MYPLKKYFFVFIATVIALTNVIVIGQSEAHAQHQSQSSQKLYAKIIKVGHPHAPAYKVEAYDPNVGQYDGAGIAYVDFYIYDGNGKQVHYKRENYAAYCSFGGNNPCHFWEVAYNGYKWPSGHPIHNGTYKLVAKVYAKSGYHKTVSTHFDVHYNQPQPQNLYAKIIWTGKKYAPAFRVKAYNPHVGQYDGAGIAYVDFYIYDGNGKQVHYKREHNAAYCAFGGDAPCGRWYFAKHHYEWPDGYDVYNGTYKLVAKVYAKNGHKKIVETHFQVHVGN